MSVIFQLEGKPSAYLLIGQEDDVLPSLNSRVSTSMRRGRREIWSTETDRAANFQLEISTTINSE